MQHVYLETGTQRAVCSKAQSWPGADDRTARQQKCSVTSDISI